MSDQREQKSHAAGVFDWTRMRPVRGLGEPQTAYRIIRKGYPDTLLARSKDKRFLPKCQSGRYAMISGKVQSKTLQSDSKVLVETDSPASRRRIVELLMPSGQLSSMFNWEQQINAATSFLRVDASFKRW